MAKNRLKTVSTVEQTSMRCPQCDCVILVRMDIEWETEP